MWIPDNACTLYLLYKNLIALMCMDVRHHFSFLNRKALDLFAFEKMSWEFWPYLMPLLDSSSLICLADLDCVIFSVISIPTFLTLFLIALFCHLLT